MKNTVIIFLIFTSIAIGQNKFITKTGTINFEASVPSFERVAATNNSATAIINSENGELAVLAFVKAFRFENALMEEHFNENYAESDKFPKATFKGKILDFIFDNLNGTTNLLVQGDLEFHNETKHFAQIPISLKLKNNKIYLSGRFSVLASDFKIKIPKIVQTKVSNTVEVVFNFELYKKQ
ncbi:hypothetical protein LS48_01245 [Aequorivita aquimaris]|uniref:Lipid/polyisoprenoid-binding YceI-like domain-containing protein n=1 Tax=Aequorivita aquimaris TaxID=1548749 RepID=A0A137RMJ4_9FLAO|nr:YceI family protein [Aequorivita aquimaris]KXO01408.1 hypothetical protein LS48_01245 [Aequorivita aquimaris]